MKRKTLRTLFLAAIAALGLCRTAHSTLFVDLRVTSVTGQATTNGANSVQIAAPGVLIEMEIWGRVQGWNNYAADDAIQHLSGSIVSYTGWNSDRVLGTLEATVEPAFSGLGSSAGLQTDLDGDGDLDVGSNLDAQTGDFFAVRSDSGPVTGNLLLIGHASFVVDQITSATALTEIVFVPRRAATAATWNVDGYPQTLYPPHYANFQSGYSVSVSAIAIPEPLAVFGAVATFASALRPKRRK